MSKDAQGMTVCNVDCPRVSYIRLPLSRVEGIKGIALYDGDCQLAAEEDNVSKGSATHLKDRTAMQTRYLAKSERR